VLLKIIIIIMSLTATSDSVEGGDGEKKVKMKLIPNICGMQASPNIATTKNVERGQKLLCHYSYLTRAVVCDLVRLMPDVHTLCVQTI
jgi:hypothetical protein